MTTAGHDRTHYKITKRVLCMLYAGSWVKVKVTRWLSAIEHHSLHCYVPCTVGSTVISWLYCCTQYDRLLAWCCLLSVCDAVHCGSQFYNFRLPIPILSPQTPHLLNHRCWYHLANTLKTYCAQANRRNYHVWNSNRQHTTDNIVRSALSQQQRPCNDYSCYGALEIIGAITIIINSCATC